MLLCDILKEIEIQKTGDNRKDRCTMGVMSWRKMRLSRLFKDFQTELFAINAIMFENLKPCVQIR